MFKRFFKTLSAETAYTRTYKELNALSDYDLRDIGICRGEIHDIAKRCQQEEDANAKSNFKAEHRLFEVHP